MGFFKDFKEDLTQAVNELMPEEVLLHKESEEKVVNPLDLKVEDDFSPLSDEHGPDVQADIDTVADIAMTEKEIQINDEKLAEEMKDEVINMDSNLNSNVDMELLDALGAKELSSEAGKENEATKEIEAAKEKDIPLDDVTVITKGTTINGGISSDGSLDIMGTIIGDVECLGKLTITGKITGNSTAAEVYVNAERLMGNINSEGSVKVGQGSIIIGDIVATSGVIAGAIKGEIDINGPIVIDATAIIKGNIKAKSVQINNGAVIEGYCSLCYASVNVDNVFE